MYVLKNNDIKESCYTMNIVTSKTIWDEFFSRSSFSNLLQSWNYGEAKAKLDGWVVQRGVIQKDGISVGLCQWLEWPILKLLKVIRINRGPILFNEQLGFEEKSAIYYFLGEYFSIYRRNLLFIAPALIDGVENERLLKNLGYKKRKNILSWKSSLIHLKKSEQELRSSLQSRLRNYVKRSENENFLYETSVNKMDFISLIERYVQLQKEKKFIGVSAKFVQLLYDLDTQDGEVLITRVLNQYGELMAEKFIIIHGNQSTPLVAWTSDKGAKCHAMHFLMWKTILNLKSRGIVYFDVGGYNEKERSSVCQFKKGFGGEEYCLVGEYRRFF